MSSYTAHRVVTRIWRTGFDESRLDELQRFAEEVSAPMFGRLPGCLGYVYAVTGSTWVTQTFWESEKHVAEAEASSLYRDVVDRILAAGFLDGEQTTEVLAVTGYALPPA